MLKATAHNSRKLFTLSLSLSFNHHKLLYTIKNNLLLYQKIYHFKMFKIGNTKLLKISYNAKNSSNKDTYETMALCKNLLFFIASKQPCASS
ncbi:hypothetical protein [Helicobacter cetorum]|uniref:hypothetical protein n=1 Tax=Helicobacter cetorum TaxID=138563 RepID=UPI0018F81C0F|nr:hypothetical protein [Helicobacter cetorum]